MKYDFMNYFQNFVFSVTVHETRRPKSGIFEILRIKQNIIM